MLFVDELKALIADGELVKALLDVDNAFAVQVEQFDLHHPMGDLSALSKSQTIASQMALMMQARSMQSRHAAGSRLQQMFCATSTE